MWRRSGALLAGAALALLAREGAPRAQAVTPAAAEAPGDDAVEKERTSFYREGVAFAEAGRWGEALERFQRVVALRSAPRALLALASAEEHVGRLVAAKRTYGKARDDARAQQDDALAAKAEAALAALEPRVPTLVLALRAGVEGADARLDGTPIDVHATSVEVDPGVYHLVVTAPGSKPFEERVVIATGQRKEITVELSPAGPAPAGAPLVQSPGADHAPAPARVGPPVGAWILGGVGVAAAAAGLAYRLHQRSIYDGAAPLGTVESVDRGNTARDRMLVGTIVAGVGVGLIGAGALWWTLAPTPAGGTAVALGGTF